MASPQTRRIKREYPELLLAKELAEMINVSQSTIKRWRNEGKLVPEFFTMMGSTKVWLYRPEDVHLAMKVRRIE